ncbi:hypothetical protein [Amycolatopsis sp. CB00013]|uniref:hypothetical protein n=1 Tax=Amycolatopsis sp. CB00013 TaxID=1703945 RepID=UPI0011612332|nr:hypothetical protein [Amycolatopsis sp. CB00013]
MVFYNLLYKLSCRLAPTKEISDDRDIPVAIKIDGNVDGLELDNVEVSGMRLMDVSSEAKLNDVRMKRVKASFLPPPRHASFRLRAAVDGLGFIGSVITVVPVVRATLDYLRDQLL